jgi:preprotein translocase subunit Sss1
MSETVISVNFENIVTITIIGVIGFAFVRLIVTAYKNYTGQTS